MNKIAAIVEARMGSSRLPGKVLLQSNGNTMLEILAKRLKRVKAIDQIIIATTCSEQDDIIEAEALRLGVTSFRGSENDVLDRVLQASRSNKIQTIVEITADCPLIDPDIVSLVINSYLHNECDYASNCVYRSYPDGMDVQVYSTDILEHSSKIAQTSIEREHVTLHIRNNPQLYKHLNIVAPESCYWPELGLTLDEPSDYELIDKLVTIFSHNSTELDFSCLDCIAMLHSNPILKEINGHVKRKGDT